MSVALLAPRLPPQCDGVGDHAAFIARSLAERGHGVVVFSERSAHVAGVDTTAISRWNSRSVFATVRAARARHSTLLLIEYTPFNFGPRTLAPHAIALLLRLCGLRIGVFLHEGFYGAHSLHVVGPVKRALLGLRDALMVALSHATFTASDTRSSELRTKLPLLASRLHVLPIGANIEPAPGDIWVPPADRPYRMVTFGVVGPKRRLEPLIRLLGAARERGVVLELAVVGRLWDAAYAERCRRLARDLGVAERVRFTGSLEPREVSRELLRAHLAVTALLEGVVSTSGSMLALLAHGLPVLAVRTAHDEPAFADCVAFTNDDPAAFLDAALAIVGSADAGAALGRAARKRYERCFRWSDIAGKAAAITLARRPRRQARGG